MSAIYAQPTDAHRLTYTIGGDTATATTAAAATATVTVVTDMTTTIATTTTATASTICLLTIHYLLSLCPSNTTTSIHFLAFPSSTYLPTSGLF